MCDIDTNVWNLVARAPAGITFAAALAVLASPEAFPAGAVPFFVGLVVVASMARLVKLLTVATRAEWALRPSMPGFELSPGFPSSHTAVIAFACTTCWADAIAAVCVHARRGLVARRVALAVVLSVLTVLVGASRVVTRCHTLLQVVVGAIFGLLLGGLYIGLFYRSMAKSAGNAQRQARSVVSSRPN